MEQPKPKFEFRNRSQVYLGPVDIEALIEAGHPARAIWALLESLDFSGFEEQILSREGQAGRAATPPRLLAALWIYGYSLGVGSARALERMQAHEPGLRWLCADQAVNHHTLSDFRVRHEQALDALFTQVPVDDGAGRIAGFDYRRAGRHESAGGEQFGELSPAADAGRKPEAGPAGGEAVEGASRGRRGR